MKTEKKLKFVKNYKVLVFSNSNGKIIEIKEKKKVVSFHLMLSAICINKSFSFAKVHLKTFISFK
jgi:hypothetical protein